MPLSTLKGNIKLVGSGRVVAVWFQTVTSLQTIQKHSVKWLFKGMRRGAIDARPISAAMQQVQNLTHVIPVHYGKACVQLASISEPPGGRQYREHVGQFFGCGCGENRPRRAGSQFIWRPV